jgi:hypothetical protein
MAHGDFLNALSLFDPEWGHLNQLKLILQQVHD